MKIAFGVRMLKEYVVRKRNASCDRLRNVRQKCCQASGETDFFKDMLRRHCTHIDTTSLEKVIQLLKRWADLTEPLGSQC